MLKASKGDGGFEIKEEREGICVEISGGGSLVSSSSSGSGEMISILTLLIESLASIVEMCCHQGTQFSTLIFPAAKSRRKRS